MVDVLVAIQENCLYAANYDKTTPIRISECALSHNPARRSSRNTKAGEWRSLPLTKQVRTANEKSGSTINCIQRTMVGVTLRRTRNSLLWT